MTAVIVEPVGTRGNQQVVRAMITADVTPEPLPTNGADVIGMTADQVFAPMSTLYVVAQDAETKLFIANEQGVFVAQ